jgi:Flp pilus assembly protein TadG
VSDERGTSAVEFALLGPVLCVLLAGMADFGGAVYVKLSLDGCVSAASNYALTTASTLNPTSAPTLASNLAQVLSSSQSTNWADSNVVLNNGPTVSITGGVATSGGTAMTIANCYCPTLSTGLNWGNAVPCGSSCPNGSLAGRFVSLSASRTYSPIFSSYGIVQNGVINASSVVQLQ